MHWTRKRALAEFATINFEILKGFRTSEWLGMCGTALLYFCLLYIFIILLIILLLLLLFFVIIVIYFYCCYYYFFFNGYIYIYIYACIHMYTPTGTRFAWFKRFRFAGVSGKVAVVLDEGFGR